MFHSRSWESTVSTVNWLQAGQSGVQMPATAKKFTFPKMPTYVLRLT